MAYDLDRDRLVVFGGRSDEAYVNTADTWEFDGQQWTERLTQTSPPPIAGGQMVYDATRKRMVLFGGFDTQGVFSGTWEYDGTNWTQPTLQINPPAGNYALAYDSTRHLVIAVGAPHAETATLAQTWEYDGASWTERIPPTSPPAGADVIAYDAARQRVVLFGGTRQFDWELGQTWEYDGTNWSQRDIVGPEPRSGHVMTYDKATGHVVLFGGFSSANSRLESDTWEYDGTSWTQRSLSQHPEARTFAAMTYDAVRNRVVLFEGSKQTFLYGSGANNMIWTYDGATWMQLASNVPSPRYASAMVYDADLNRIVLFGGYQGGPDFLGDTWEYDGKHWTRLNLPVSPSPRYGHAMVYDAARRRVVLFGGVGNGYLSDTWEFNGTAWTKIQMLQAPSAREGHAMAYDPVRHRVVLFGGETFSTGGLGDTWENEGTTWTPRTPPNSPAARCFQAMTFDPALGHVVLFGGAKDAQQTEQFADTWKYDGINWTQRLSPTAPSARSRHAMAYDAALGQIVLFGGFDYLPEYDVADTWTYNDPAWTQLNPTDNPGPFEPAAATYDPGRQAFVLINGFEYGMFNVWELTTGLFIHRDPVSRVVPKGSSTDLSVIAEGPDPLSYRWFRNGLSLTDTPNILGTSSSVLQIKALSSSEVGQYSCMVTDACGASATSAIAKVVFCKPDLNADAHVDYLDIFVFLRAWFVRDRNADFDGDLQVTVSDIFSFLRAWFARC